MFGSKKEKNTGDGESSGEPATDEDTAVPGLDSYWLEFVDRADPQPANIWNGLAAVEDGFAFTTMVSKHLTIRFMDMDLLETSNVLTLTTDDDIDDGDHITDHAFMRVGDYFYLVFGTNNLDDLYLMQLDIDGARLQLISVQDEGDDPTQDPHLLSDGERICVRWGSDGFEKRVG